LLEASLERNGAVYKVSLLPMERVAAVYNKMSIVSINTKLSEGEALRLYASLFDKARSGPSTDLASSKD